MTLSNLVLFGSIAVLILVILWISNRSLIKVEQVGDERWLSYYRSGWFSFTKIDTVMPCTSKAKAEVVATQEWVKNCSRLSSHAVKK